MKDREFRPLPEEFNLGYKPPERAAEEEEKKKKKKAQIKKLLVLATSVFIILPLVLRTGLFRGNAAVNHSLNGPVSLAEKEKPENTYNREAPQAPEGNYVSGNTYLHLENARGWFFNGTYFIPLHYDEDLNYSAAGAYPEQRESSLRSTVCYVTSSGTIEVLEEMIRIRDPFDQQDKLFQKSEKTFNTTYIDGYNSLGFTIHFLFGEWKGLLVPEADYPAAYLQSLVLEPSKHFVLVAGDTLDSHSETYEGEWDLQDGVLRLKTVLPLHYEIAEEERTIRYDFKDAPEGILFITEDGLYLQLNVFASQIFGR